jgi:hypothetical protein
MVDNPRPRLVVILELVGLVLSGGAVAQTVPITPADAARGALAQQTSTGPAAGGPQVSAPSPQAGSVYVPESSKPQPGSSAHTNYLLRGADGKKPVGVRTPSEGAFGGSLAR